MTKDYAKKRRPHVAPRSHKRTAPTRARDETQGLMPAWGWMSAGLILGLTLSAVLYWKMHPSQQPLLAGLVKNSKVTKTLKAAATPLESATEEPKPRFDFYTVLPSLSLEVPEETVANAKPSATPTTPPSPSTYLLQAGSFRQRAQAEELKAQLALSGFEASLQTINIDKNTWYRVALGPFKNKDEALKSQQQVDQALSLHSVVVKIHV